MFAYSLFAAMRTSLDGVGIPQYEPLQIASAINNYEKAHMQLERAGDCMCNSPKRFVSVLVSYPSRSARPVKDQQASNRRVAGTLLSANSRVKIKKRFTGANITQEAPAFGEGKQTIPRRVRLL
jgi:hypothetical protein